MQSIDLLSSIDYKNYIFKTMTSGDTDATTPKSKAFFGDVNLRRIELRNKLTRLCETYGSHSRNMAEARRPKSNLQKTQKE